MIDRRTDLSRKSYRTFIACLVFTVAVWIACTADIVYLRLQKRHQLAQARAQAARTAQQLLDEQRYYERRIAEIKRRLK